MINQVLFEHETPSLDDIQKSLFEWIGINSEPVLKDMHALNFLNFFIYLLICVDLKPENSSNGCHASLFTKQIKQNTILF